MKSESIKKIKRLLTEEEMDKFLELREVDNKKAARYMKSLENDLYEVTDDEYVKNKRKK